MMLNKNLYIWLLPAQWMYSCLETDICKYLTMSNKARAAYLIKENSSQSTDYGYYSWISSCSPKWRYKKRLVGQNKMNLQLKNFYTFMHSALKAFQ